MELIFILTTLCISLSVMLTPCASHLLQVQSSHNLADDHDHKVTLHKVLPRKLKVMNEAAPVMEKGDKDLSSQKKQVEDISGKADQKGGDHEKGRIHGSSSRGTRQEWVEGSDVNISQFFTMDYSHVRRRRPIHNKSLPVAP